MSVKIQFIGKASKPEKITSRNGESFIDVPVSIHQTFKTGNGNTHDYGFVTFLVTGARSRIRTILESVEEGDRLLVNGTILIREPSARGTIMGTRFLVSAFSVGFVPEVEHGTSMKDDPDD